MEGGKNGKTVRIRFRTTEKQKAHVNSQCEKYGIKNAEYLRRLIDADMGETEPLQTKEDFLARKQFIYEINRIGNNINQIVRNVNMEYYSEYEKKKLFAMTRKIMELLENMEKGENRDETSDGSNDRGA